MAELETLEVPLEDGSKVKVVKAESVEALRKEMEDQLKAKEEELKKEKEKEKNFRALRTKKLSELSQEEKDALSAKEKVVVEGMQELEERQNKWEQGMKNTWKEAALTNLGLANNAESVDDRKRVLAAFDRLRDPEDTAEAIASKMNVAYSITFQRAPNVNQHTIDRGVNFGGGGMRVPDKKQNFADTPQGQDLARRLGLNFEQPKK